MIILPGMAFTKNGKRLGHGMGYYDRYLQMVMLRQNKKPFTVAVAFNEQVHQDIPTNEQDYILDIVLTEKFG